MQLKSISFYLFALSLIFNIPAFSLPVIRPVLIAGEITYAMDKSTPFAKLQAGVKLTPDALISIPEGGYIALLQNNANLVEYDEQGEYTVSEILRRGKKGSIPQLNRYYLSLYKTLTGSRLPLAAASNAFPAEQEQVLIDFPADTYLIDTVLNMSWHPGRFSGNYLVEILNSSGTVLYSSATTDTTISFNLDKLQIKPESMFQVIIRNLNIPGTSSIPVTLVRYSRQQSEKIWRELRPVLKHPQITSPVNQLALAQYYEKYRLINRAYECLRVLHNKLYGNPGYLGLLSSFREEHFIITP